MTEDSLGSPNDQSAATQAIPRDYCIIKTNWKSFRDTSKKFTWTINGHEITVDSAKEFKVATHAGLDTVIFFKTLDGAPEIILCDLVKRELYQIYYNMCCDDFNFYNVHTRHRNQVVEFELKEEYSNTKLIGGVDSEAGFLKAGKPISLTGDYARSAMFPNRYRVFVQAFVPWHEDSTLDRVINPLTRNELRPFKDPDQKLIDFQYIFLDSDTLRILVDSKSRVSVERIK